MNSDAYESIRSEWKVQVSRPSILDSITSVASDVAAPAPSTALHLRFRVMNTRGSI